MSSPIIPSIHYRQSARALAFLCDAFGFTKQFAVQDKDGSVEHAQLTFGNAMIMIGQARDSEFGKLQQPPQPGQPVNQSVYVVVDDADAHCKTAREAGAEIVMEPEDQDYGGRLYVCRDFEGHVWSFGTYDPWAEEG